MAIYYGMLLSISRPDKVIYLSRQVSCLGVRIYLEFECWEAGFVDFAEAEGVGGESFTSFDFYEVFVPLSAVVEGETNGVLVVVGFKFFASKATSR